IKNCGARPVVTGSGLERPDEIHAVEHARLPSTAPLGLAGGRLPSGPPTTVSLLLSYVSIEPRQNQRLHPVSRTASAANAGRKPMPSAKMTRRRLLGSAAACAGVLAAPARARAQSGPLKVGVLLPR